MLRTLLLLSPIVVLPALSGECGPVNVGFRVMRIGGRNSAVWYPADANSKPASHAYNSHISGLVAAGAPPVTACEKPVPLVVFSHGDFGCGLQSVAFTEELARQGYVVVAPDHADAAFCHVAPLAPGIRAKRPTQPSFFKPEDWNDSTFSNRRDDVEAVLNGILNDSEFKAIIDPQRIGAAGHSLGGYTVVGLAGGWPKWKDARIRAVLAFSPYLQPFHVRNTIAGIRIPIMYQGGTLDFGITPFLAGPDGAYAETHPPAYFMELKRAGHLAWANCAEERSTSSCLAHRQENRLINQYGIAFFNRYLKNLPEPVLNNTSNPSLARFEFKLVKP